MAPETPAKQDDRARALEILEAAAAVMKDAPAMVVSMNSVDQNEKRVLKLKRPDLARLESSGRGQDLTTILDGKNWWVYSKSRNQYWMHPQTAGMVEQFGGGLITTLFYRKGAGKLLERATEVSVKKEKLGLEEVDLIAWKRGRLKSRLWIDVRKAVRQIQEENQDEKYAFTYGPVDLAPKLADDTFTFTPPKGATEREKGLLAIGTEAPDFEATDLNGKAVKLSDFKGKPVVVTFWFYG